MPGIAQDLRFSLRQFRKSPGYVIAAAVTLALGIGANTALFTVIDSVLIRPLPYPDADRLFTVGERSNGPDIHSTSWLNLQALRQQSKSFEDIGGYTVDVAILQTSHGGETVIGPRLTGNLLRVLRVQPLLGRIFNDADCAPGAPHTVIFSEKLWRKDFAADPHILGREVRIGDVPYTVIGVMPVSFAFPDEGRADATRGLWVPSETSEVMRKERGFTIYALVGRLRTGVSERKAAAELAAIAANVKKLDPNHTTGLHFALRPYRETVTGSVRPVFLALSAALGLVLLIACANVANLQLSRCLARHQELAVRTALGAPKWRLMRELMVEGGTLSCIGAVLGMALAIGILRGVQMLPEDMLPRANEIHLRFAVIAALAVLATLATVLSSVIPALFAMNAEPQSALRGSGRGISQGSARSRTAGLLVMGEVAIAAVLLVACSLLFRTLYNLEHKYLGFDVENVVMFNATPPTSSGYLNSSEQSGSANSGVATHVYLPILEELRKLPGVSQAALTSSVPFDGVDMNTSFTLNGHTNATREEQQAQHAQIRVMSGDYMKALETPMIRGRAISDDDTQERPYVAVVNQAFAREFFRNVDPIGQEIGIGRKESGMEKPYTVVGVVADAAQKGTSKPAVPELILSYRQIPEKSFFYPILVSAATNYVLRSRGHEDLGAAIHGVFRRMAPGFAIDNLQTMQKTVDAANFNQRLGFYLIGSFAGVAIVMVMVGLYGVLSQLVSQRRQEIGVRMALGATSQSILALVLRQGSVLIVAGLGAGIVMAFAASRLIASFLYGVRPMDAWSYAGAAVALAAIGLMAALVPARRAASIEPMEALRSE